MFSLAIAGLGFWGKRLVASVQGRSEAVRFVAAATRTPAKVAAFAAEHGVRLGDDLAALLDDPAIDGVVVAGPAHLHAEVGLRVLEAGKHAMVIKPLAQRLDDAKRLRRSAEANRVVLAMGHDRCFLPAVDELRKRAKAGDLGRIIHAEGDFCADRYFAMDPGDWKLGENRSPPGSLADHMLYTMVELIGPVAELSVRALHLAAPVDITDTTSISMRFASGASGTLAAIGVTPRFERLQFFGTDGWIEIRQGNRFEFMPRSGEGVVTEFPAVDLLRRQLEAFAAAARGAAAFPVTLDQAMAGVAALEAMAESAAAGKPVGVAQ